MKRATTRVATRRLPDRHIGWIGVGKMGARMCRRALAAGYRLTVLEPVVENRAIVVARGAGFASTAAELCDRARVIVLTIPDDSVLREVVLGPDGLCAHVAPGDIVVDMSTVSPRLSAEVADALGGAGAAFVRAPVSGSTQLASDGQLTILLSGPPEAVRAVEPLLATLSTRRLYLGAGEEARYMKFVLNILAGSTAAVLSEALMFGRKGGLSTRAMLDVIADSIVASPLIEGKRDMLLARDFDPAFSIQQMITDFDLVADTARAVRAPMMIAGLIRQQFELARAAGDGERDYFGLLEQFERMAGLSPEAPDEVDDTLPETG